MKKFIEEKIKEAVVATGYKASTFSVEEPPKSDFGDWSSNVAMISAGESKKNPKEVAAEIKQELEKAEGIRKVEIAGPGFLNIFLDDGLYFAELKNILAEKENYGKSGIGKSKKINVEYVSANPTGPLHIGNARSGPMGEATANLFEFLGYNVEREFYINDIGVQIHRLGESLYYWHEKKSKENIEFPEGGYPAPYIEEVSNEIQTKFVEEIAKTTDREGLINLFARKGLEILIDKIKKDLALIDINIDVWTRESEMLNSGKAKEAISKLEKSGFTKEKDGAVWFTRPDDPDLNDKDSVLVKSDENHSLTYFANDIAYHLDKLDRGSERLIDVWGANHFGHIPRMKAALQALGVAPEKLEIMLYQYVRLKKSGQAMSMGKRLGNFVTLRQVIEAGVAADAFKYFILAQNPNTPFDFDIDLAADTSEKNPVFYIKYAHARISSILRKAGENKVTFEDADLNLLTDPKEAALYKALVKFPELVLAASENFQIQSFPHYAYKIAGLFHDFYANCQVLGGEKETEKARLALITATTLQICGIDAPEKM